jgi:hypothetical protein
MDPSATPTRKEIEQDFNFNQAMDHIQKEEQVYSDDESRSQTIKAKVRAIARMSRMFKNIRSNNELLVNIKEMAPDGKIPRGLLMAGRGAMKDKFKEFLLAKDLDSVNEKRPTEVVQKK